MAPYPSIRCLILGSPEGRRYALSVHPPHDYGIDSKESSRRRHACSWFAVRPFTGLQEVPYHLNCNVSWPGKSRRDRAVESANLSSDFRLTDAVKWFAASR